MQEFYNHYYAVTATSVAYATFCERVFGCNFAQHGFSDMGQVDALLETAHLGPDNRVLELGCGNGGIAEYISDLTGAHVTGIDYSPVAIDQAQVRTATKRDRLDFRVADIVALPFEPASFDTILSIDTLYFTDLSMTIGQLKRLLTPDGQMAIFYAYGADPEHPLATFRRETLPADRTPLGVVLAAHTLSNTARDFTADDLRHAQLKRDALEELKVAFAAEGNLFLYENRMGEALGVIAAVAAGAHARYLYHVRS